MLNIGRRFTIADINNNPYLPHITDCDHVYHYTSSNSMISILSNDGMNMWASRVDCLNDLEEENDAVRTFQKCCDELFYSKEIPSEFYSIVKNVRVSRVANVDSNADYYKILDYGAIRSSVSLCTRYVICFSKDSDSLPMWNYHSNGHSYEGVNIEIDLTELEKNLKKEDKHGFKVNIFNVVYDDKEKAALVKNCIRDIYHHSYERYEIMRYLEAYLNEWSVCFKNHCFEHEHEIRIVYYIPDTKPFEVSSTIEFSTMYRTHAGTFIPYIKDKFPKSIVKSITLGPLLNTTRKESQKEIVHAV